MKILDIIQEAKAPAAELPGELQALVSNWIARNPEKVKAVEPKLMTRYNPSMISIFKKVMLFVPITQLNLNLYALEQIAVEPLETFRSSNPAFAAYTQEQKDAYIKEARDLYYGVFAAQMVVPMLTKFLMRNTPVIRELFFALESSFGKVGGKLGAIISIATLLAAEGFIAFLGTPAGMEWLSTTVFMPIIRMSGSAVAWSWDQIWPKIQELTGMPISDINPETDAAVKRDRNSGGFASIKTMPHDEFRKSQDAMQQRLAANPNFNIVPGR